MTRARIKAILHWQEVCALITVPTPLSHKLNGLHNLQYCVRLSSPWCKLTSLVCQVLIQVALNLSKYKLKTHPVVPPKLSFGLCFDSLLVEGANGVLAIFPKESALKTTDVIINIINFLVVVSCLSRKLSSSKNNSLVYILITNIVFISALLDFSSWKF